MEPDRLGHNFCINCGEQLRGSFVIVEKKIGFFGKQRASYCNNYDKCVDKCLEAMEAGFEILKLEIQ